MALKKQIKNKQTKDNIILTNSAKNQNNRRNNQNNSRGKVWKIIAIVFIVIFALIIISALFKLFHFKNSLKPATDAEINSAKKTALNKIVLIGGNASNYIVRVSEGIRYVESNHTKKRVIEVTLRNNQTDNSGNSNRHIFLIDADSQQVLMHSETEFYGWMNDDFGKFDSNRRFGARPPPLPSSILPSPSYSPPP